MNELLSATPRPATATYTSRQNRRGGWDVCRHMPDTDHYTVVATYDIDDRADRVAAQLNDNARYEVRR